MPIANFPSAWLTEEHALLLVIDAPVGDEGGQTGALDGGASAMAGAVRVVDACGGRCGARGGVEDVGECHVVLLG